MPATLVEDRQTAGIAVGQPARGAAQHLFGPATLARSVLVVDGVTIASEVKIMVGSSSTAGTNPTRKGLFGALDENILRHRRVYDVAICSIAIGCAIAMAVGLASTSVVELRQLLPFLF